VLHALKLHLFFLYLIEIRKFPGLFFWRILTFFPYKLHKRGDKDGSSQQITKRSTRHRQGNRPDRCSHQLTGYTRIANLPRPGKRGLVLKLSSLRKSNHLSRKYLSVWPDRLRLLSTMSQLR